MSANEERPDPTGDDARPGFAAQLRLAAVFLTRLPVTIDAGATPIALARAMPLFALVGAAIGGLAGLALPVGHAIGLPAGVAVVATLAAMLWLTGALHEDGLADVADGFGGGRDRDRKLAIMRDSRIGSYGVLAPIVAFGLKATALAAIALVGPWHAVAALVAATAWSRSLFAPLMRWLPPARDDGVGAGAGTPDSGETWRGVVLGAGLALLVTLAGAGGGALLALAAGGIAGFLVGWLALDHIGGYTGDVLGAAQQAAETATLVALSAAMTGGWV